MALDVIHDVRTFMLATFLVAVLFAVIHDRFNAWLDGKDATALNQHISSNIGVVCAFIVKFFLSITIITSYTQLLWHTLLGDRMSIGMIDTLILLTGSPLQLRNLSGIVKHPMLLILAFISWIVPLVAVIPSGSLTVQLRPITHEDWQPLVFVGFGPDGIADVDSAWVLNATIDDYRSEFLDLQRSALVTDPTPSASKLASYVGWSSTMPVFSNTKLSITYNLTFNGPAIHCDTALWNSSWPLRCVDSKGDLPYGSGDLSYYSWAMNSGNLMYPTGLSTLGDSPYFGLSNVSAVFLDQNATMTVVNCDPDKFSEAYRGNDIKLYIGLNQNPFQHGTTIRDDNAQWSLTTCELRNASYNVFYNMSTQQATNLQVVAQPFAGISDSWLAGLSEAAKIRSENRTNVFGTVPVDLELRRSFYETTTFLANFKLLENLVTGSYVYGASQQPNSYNTQLALTPEFGSQDWSRSTHLSSSQLSDQTIGSLAYVLEELMQNITIATMSSGLLDHGQGGMRSKITVLNNIYVYNQLHLWASYGLGLLVGGIVVCLGIVQVTTTHAGAGYSSKFSTYYRVLQHSPGADPLPANIARRTLKLGPGQDYALIPMAMQGQPAANKQDSGDRDEAVMPLRRATPDLPDATLHRRTSSAISRGERQVVWS